MIVLIIGIEGSGHHFVLDLFRNSSSKYSIESHIDSQSQKNLNDEILNLYLKVFKDENLQINSEPDELVDLQSFYDQFERIVRKYSNHSDSLQILDLSIPFNKGKSRHLRSVDYFKLSEFLNPDETKIIFLERDIISVTRSVYFRKIEDSLIEACYSTQNSLMIFNQALRYFENFQKHTINYDNFSNDIDTEIIALEKFFESKINFSKEQFKPTKPNFEYDFLINSFWKDRMFYFEKNNF